MKNYLQNLVGYLIVIGVIVTITSVILYMEHRPKGRYAEKIKEDVLYRVVKVLDGDTLIAHVENHDITLRLIGIDTPEVVDPRKPVQCYGPEASAKAHELLEGREVYIEKEAQKVDYDKYGRVLSYVHFTDGSLYNEYMIHNGFAREYTFNREKYKYQKEFKEAQEKAQKEKMGLWGKCPSQ